MNFLKFKYKKDKISFEAPDNWGEVPFYKFVQFQNKELTPTQVYELFTGVSSEYWNKPHDPSLYASIDGQLAFLSEEPKTEIPDALERNGELYKIKKDFLNVPLGKYRDLIEVYHSVSKEHDNIIELMPKMISIFCCHVYDDEDELNEIAKEIEKMPTDLVYSLGVFFCQKLSELSNGTQKKWLKGIVKKILTIPKLVTTKLLASMVIFILCLTSPKVIYQSMMIYLKEKLLKFTGRNRLKVVSINQKHFTIT